MGLVWNPWALPGIAAVALAAALAWIVYAAAPQRRVNRALAILLAADALDWGALVGAQLTLSLAAGYAWVIVHFVGDVFVIGAYLLFLGAALDTPLARPLTSRRGKGLIITAGATAAAIIILFPKTMLIGAVHTGHAYYPVFGIPGPWLWLLWGSMVACFTFGLAAAVDARRRAGTEIARRRTTAYLWAFGLRDAVLVISFGKGLLELVLGLESSFNSFFSVFTIAGVGSYVVVLAYAILREQLFDIDLKIKLAISKSTVVALFASLVFIASEFVEQLLGVDQLVPAILAAGIVALAMRPLVRVGERVAERVMPGVTDTNEYRLVRKREVYRAAIESALEDGEMSTNDQRVLATLADHLGLGERELHDLEREAHAARGVA